MTSYDEVARRWVSVVEGSSQSHLTSSGGRMYASGDKIYSYGSHFELGRPLRRNGAVVGYLLNGDRYSNTTSKHQAVVRGALGDRETIILPYTALEAAGIDLDTVQPVHVSPDRWETFHHSVNVPPPGAQWRAHKNYEWRPLTDEEMAEMLARKDAERHAEWERLSQYEWYHHPEPRPLTPEDLKHERKRVDLPDTHTFHTSGLPNAPEIHITYGENGNPPLYEWTTNRHWLGESLIRARVTWPGRRICTWCNGHDGPLEGPPDRYWGRHPRCHVCGGGGMVRTTHHRWAYFLAGFDGQESRPSFFFCELPYRSHPKTVAEAYEALKPDPVRLAEQMGRSVTRQGDIFAVPTRLTRKELKARGARIERRRKAEDELPYMLNTNHTATEVAYLGKLTLARGTMYHDPQWRAQDHARRRMGNGADWHIIIKNTVPVSGRR